MASLISFVGVGVLVGLAMLLSTDRRNIKWRPVISGILLQFVLAVLLLKTAWGNAFFDWVKRVFVGAIEMSKEGNWLFGYFDPAQPVPLAITITATIVFVSSLMSILYHVGIMQRVVYVMAVVMQKTMRVSGAESLSAAANVFVGQTEAPLLIRPYLAGMTSSELAALMCGGMATVAGGVLAVYITTFQIDPGALLAASVMSAPAALAVAKIIAPETGEPVTSGKVPLELRRDSHNMLDAACRGAGEGIKLAINVIAMLIAFLALVALVNAGIAALYNLFSADGTPLTLERMLGWLFAPIAWVIGVEWTDAPKVGQLLGVKMVLNEFVAYERLSDMTDLAPRSRNLATYALCGFANFSSIAIQIGGIGALEPEIRPKLAKLGLRAMLGGTLAALMTAAVVGVLD